MQKVHVTIDNGYKGSTSNINMYYKLLFPENKVKPGDKYVSKAINGTIKYYNNDTVTNLSAKSQDVAYTILDPNNDYTNVSGIDRTVYNLTEQTNNYMTHFGNLYIRNEVELESKYEKIIEADYNTTNAAAEVLAITIPKGTNSDPSMEITGYDSNGEEKTVYLKGSDLGLRAYLSSGYTYDYYKVKAADIGLSRITHMKADIGRYQKMYRTSSWTSVYTA